MYMTELAVIAVSIALFIVSMIYHKALIWFIPLCFNCGAFYLGVINSWSSLVFVVIGGFAIIALIGTTLLLLKGDLI